MYAAVYVRYATAVAGLQRSGGNRFAVNNSGFCQVFQRFAIGCCRVIKVFDKTKADAIFRTGAKSDHNGSDVIAVLPGGFGKSLLLLSTFCPIFSHRSQQAISS